VIRPGRVGLAVILQAGTLVAAGPCQTALPALPALPGDSVLGETPLGSVYHKVRCLPQHARPPLVIFAPGTGITPARSRTFTRFLGDQSGQCVIAVAYENSKLVASYCTTTDSTGGPQDPACLERVLGAKASSNPSVAMATNGTRLEVPFDRSVEGGILRALEHLGLSRFLSSDGREVRWYQLVLTGHSQGAQLAMFIALTRHEVAGVGSIGGGVLRTAGVSPYPRFVYEARKTDPARFRAFHHQNDADAFRRDVYSAMGIPAANIRTTDFDSEECRQNAHSCVVVDELIPVKQGLPIFVDQWRWVSSSPK